jgi:adenosylhomocysteine nucleosidase
MPTKARALRHIALFAATRWEQRAARAALTRIASPPASTAMAGVAADDVAQRWFVSTRYDCRLTLVQSGIGPEQAGRAARQLIRHERCDLMMSIGFACALIPSAPGDLLIGADVVWLPVGMGLSTDPGVPAIGCDPSFQATAVQAAKSGGLAARGGRIVTAARVLVHADEKRGIARATGAIGLDMESAALGAIAMEYRTPFLVARTASDLLNEDLPLDFNLFLTPSGWARGALGLLRPASLFGLRRLRRQTRLASERLTTFLERFLEELIPAPLINDL